MIVNKYITTKEFMTGVLNEAQNLAIKEQKEIINNKKEEQKILEAGEGVLNKVMSADEKRAKRCKFLEDTKVALLSECLYKIYDESQGIHIPNEGDESIKHALVTNFIRENGATTLLNDFKYKSTLLSEISCLVNRYYTKIQEQTDPLTSEFSIDTSVTDDFFKELNLLDTGEAVETIRMRVTAAMNEFINDNVNNKNDIEAALRDAKDKAFLTSDESVKESYEIQAKHKISDIRNRSKNVFGCMVQNMAEAVIKNDDLKPEYMIESKTIDLDKIVERTKIMYSFIEMVNTLKMDIVDEAYIKETINTIK